MPTQNYMLNGVKVPGVTTVIGHRKEVGGLLHWAWKAGSEGKDYRDLRDAAATAGTACHEMIDCDWHGKPFDRSKYAPEILEKADHSYLGYLEMKQQMGLTVVKAELALVSKLGFGGCMDAVVTNGKLSIGDYKTSNSIHVDMLIQIAGGYAILHEEHFPDEQLHGIHIFRFSKPTEPTDPVSFHHHFYTAEIFDVAKEQFRDLLRVYNRDKKLKGLL